MEATADCFLKNNNKYKQMKSMKLKAFTLAEMLVVLVVSSLVVSMAFLVLNMVRKQVISIQKNNHKKQEVQSFDARFYSDFNTHSVFYDESSDVFRLKNTKEMITYTFLDKFIVRETDTFFIEVVDKKLFLEGTEVKQQTIDAIEIHLSPQFANKQLFVQKTKDASYYMN